MIKIVNSKTNQLVISYDDKLYYAFKDNNDIKVQTKNQPYRIVANFPSSDFYFLETNDETNYINGCVDCKNNIDSLDMKYWCLFNCIGGNKFIHKDLAQSSE